MARDIPHIMPFQLGQDVNIALRGEDFADLSDNARFIIRREVSAAYAKGFLDGRLDQMNNDSTDRAIERDRKTNKR